MNTKQNTELMEEINTEQENENSQQWTCNVSKNASVPNWCICIHCNRKHWNIRTQYAIQMHSAQYYQNASLSPVDICWTVLQWHIIRLHVNSWNTTAQFRKWRRKKNKIFLFLWVGYTHGKRWVYGRICFLLYEM